MSEPITSFTHDGLTFDVRDAGPRDGQVVILLHGFPEDSSSWNAVTPALNAAGLRTLAPDQRGYSPGASPSRVADYAMEHLVEDVLALADATHAKRFHLVGHDWGGAVAWYLASSAPGRVASATILSTPHPAALAQALRTPGQLRKSWYMGAFQVPRLPERALSGHVGRFLTSTGLDATNARRCDARFATPASLRGPINWYRALARGTSGGSPGPVPVPTSYVWGSRDVALGRTAAEATAAHVDADYRFVELDASHWLPELNAAEVTREILGRTSQTPPGTTHAAPPAS